MVTKRIRLETPMKENAVMPKTQITRGHISNLQTRPYNSRIELRQILYKTTNK